MDRSVPSGSHICAFYSGCAGRDEVVLPFLAEGLRTGHKCLAVLGSTSPGEVLAMLHDRGVDADQAAQAGQIEVETPANAYFRSGTSSTDDIIAFWGQGSTRQRHRHVRPHPGDGRDAVGPGPPAQPHGVLPVRGHAEPVLSAGV